MFVLVLLLKNAKPLKLIFRTWEKEFLMRLFLVEGLYSSRVTLQVSKGLLTRIYIMLCTFLF
jgi:hypothetical protein